MWSPGFQDETNSSGIPKWGRISQKSLEKMPGDGIGTVTKVQGNLFSTDLKKPHRLGSLSKKERLSRRSWTSPTFTNVYTCVHVNVFYSKNLASGQRQVVASGEELHSSFSFSRLPLDCLTNESSKFTKCPRYLYTVYTLEKKPLECKRDNESQTLAGNWSHHGSQLAQVLGQPSQRREWRRY